MKSLARWRLVVLAILVVGLITGARYYLSSRHAANQVANRLQGLLGVDVHVGEVAIGLGGSSSLKNVEIFEAPGPDGASPAVPFVAFESIHADVSALDLLGEKATPQDLTLNSPSVVLRFDRAGNLLTRLPVSAGATPRLPRVSVENGSITFQQEGREPFRIRGVTGELTTSEVGLKVDGKVNDPDLGKWEIHATWLSARERVAVTLTAADVPLKSSQLKRLPFLPADIWETVDCEGRAGISCTFSLGLDGQGLTYRATVEPHDLHVKILSSEEKKPTFELGGTTGRLTVHSTANGPKLSADLTDRKWGRWLVDLAWPTDSPQILVGLRTPPGVPFHVTQKQLQTLPLPAEWLKKVDLEGDLAITFGATISTQRWQHFSFRLQADPSDCRCHLTSLKPPLELDHLSGTVALSGSEFGMQLEGDLTDRTWGRWLLGGSYSDAQEVFTLDLRSPPGKRVAVTQALLAKVPEVPPSVWQEVQIPEGDTTVAFTLNIPVDGPTHYHLELDPHNTRLHIRSINLDAAQVQGKVVIDDRVVLLREVRGVSAEGEVRCDADLDFRQRWFLPAPRSRSWLTFDIVATDLRTTKLPASWHLPTLIGGLLSGKAHLAVCLDPVLPVRTIGSGEGAIRLGAGQGKIKLVLHADEKNGIRIRPDLQPPAMPNRLIGALDQPLSDEEPIPTYHLDLQFDDVSVQEMLRRLGVQLPSAGRLNGHVEASIPQDDTGDVKAWTATGSAALSELEAAGLTLTAAQIDFRLDKGVLNLDKVTADVLPPGLASSKAFRAAAGSAATLVGHAGSLQGSGQFPLSPQPGLIRFQVQGDQVPLPLPPLSGGSAVDSTFSGQLEGSLDTHAFGPVRTWEGSVRLTGARMSGYGLTLNDLKAVLEVHDGQLDINDLAGTLAGAAVTAKASLGLLPPGRLTAHAHLHEGDANGLNSLAPDIRPPLPLTGRFDLTADLTTSLSPPGDQANDSKLTLDLTAPQVRFHRIAAQRVKGRLDYQGSRGDYHLEGETLGGRFNLDGVLPTPSGQPKDGTFRLEGVRLGRLREILPDQDAFLRPLRGRGSAALDYRFGPDGLPMGSGRLVINNVRYDDTQLVHEVRAGLFLGQRGLEIRDISGDLGGGEISGSIVYNPRQPDASSFALTLDQVEASQLLLPFHPPLQADGRLEALNQPAPVEGPLEVQLRGSLGSDWRGNGSVVLNRGRVYGLEVNQWSLPFEFDVVPGEGRGEVRVSDTTLQAARGRGQGRAELTWSVGDIRLDGTLRFFDTELRGLLRSFGATSSVVVGRLSGRLDFGGTNIHSLDDLTATLDARLDGSQALELPVFRLLAPYLAPGNSALTFDRGQIRARLAHGVIHLQPLTLTSTLVQLIVEGTIHLSGALDLDVRSQTGGLSFNPVLLRQLGAQVPAIGPVPAVVVSQVSNLLAARLVHLRITGNVRNPSVRLETLQLLTDEAVRFFLGLSPVPFNR
jgi:hypothetical protein